MARPDWTHWKNMGIVSLAEAVVLSLDEEPIEDDVHPILVYSDLIPIYPFPSGEKQKRYLQAKSNFGIEGGLVEKPKYRAEIPSDVPCVDLKEFGAWAKKCGWKLPDKFPIDGCSFLYNKDGKHFLELPYPCEFLAKLAKIMADNYSLDSHKPNCCQKTVGLEIDKVAHWKSSIKGKQSTSAAQLAALIQPAKLIKSRKKK